MSSATSILPSPRPPFSEVWKKALVAILGLGFSFSAALFSTVTRESGDVAATAVLAGASLLVSVWVGLTTVPYLARRAASEVRWKNSVDFEVTRAGIVYVLATLLIGVAALNTGNNLLYLIISAMLAAVLVSGVCSSLTLGGLTLNVKLPQHVFAGEKASGSLELSNSRRWLPSLSISVVPPKERAVKKAWRSEKGTVGFPPRWLRTRQWFRVTDLKIALVAQSDAQPPVFQGAVHFPLIAARSSAQAQLELCFQRRGIYRQDAFALSTVFPFGLLVKRRNIAVARELIVYPAIEPMREFSGSLPALESDFSSLHAGQGQDLLLIRSYAAGDSASHVDWKASAKSGGLKVREFARDEDARLRLVFDNPAPGVVSEEAYERAVRLAASLAWHFAALSRQISFAAPGLVSGCDVWEFLHYLAVAQPGAGDDLLRTLPATDEFNLVLTARDTAALPANLQDASRLYPIR